MLVSFAQVSILQVLTAERDVFDIEYLRIRRASIISPDLILAYANQ